MSAFPSRTVTLLGSCLLAASAAAHVSLQQKEAAIDSPYQAVLTVPHGCQGSPTVKVRVRIPEGVADVQVPAMAGWEAQTVESPYAAAVLVDGTELSSGVSEIIWSGGSLPDGEELQFVFSAHLGAGLEPHTKLYFPVIQECETGVERWIEMSGAGHNNTGEEHSDSPAPALQLLPRK